MDSTSVLARVCAAARRWGRRLWLRARARLAARPAADVVLFGDPTRTADLAHRTGADRAALPALRLALERDRDAVTSSLADDVASTLIRFGTVRQGGARQGSVGCGMARYGMVRRGRVWCGGVR